MLYQTEENCRLRIFEKGIRSTFDYLNLVWHRYSQSHDFRLWQREQAWKGHTWSAVSVSKGSREVTHRSLSQLCFLLSHFWKLLNPKWHWPVIQFPVELWSCGNRNSSLQLKDGNLPPTLLSHQASQAPYCYTGATERIINRKDWKHLSITKTLGIQHTSEFF